MQQSLLCVFLLFVLGRVQAQADQAAPPMSIQISSLEGADKIGAQFDAVEKTASSILDAFTKEFNDNKGAIDSTQADAAYNNQRYIEEQSFLANIDNTIQALNGEKTKLEGWAKVQEYRYTMASKEGLSGAFTSAKQTLANLIAGNDDAMNKINQANEAVMLANNDLERIKTNLEVLGREKLERIGMSEDVNAALEDKIRQGADSYVVAVNKFVAARDTLWSLQTSRNINENKRPVWEGRIGPLNDALNLATNDDQAKNDAISQANARMKIISDQLAAQKEAKNGASGLKLSELGPSIAGLAKKLAQANIGIAAARKQIEFINQARNNFLNLLSQVRSSIPFIPDDQ